MTTPHTALTRPARAASLKSARRVARVLLADSDLTSRLALKTLLATAGYAVDCAANSAEAAALLDKGEFQLVLTDLNAESGEAGALLLAYARQKEYRPATALMASELREREPTIAERDAADSVVRMTDENVSALLTGVAELIGKRADRRMSRKR